MICLMNMEYDKRSADTQCVFVWSDSACKHRCVALFYWTSNTPVFTNNGAVGITHLQPAHMSNVKTYWIWNMKHLSYFIFNTPYMFVFENYHPRKRAKAVAALRCTCFNILHDIYSILHIIVQCTLHTMIKYYGWILHVTCTCSIFHTPY